MSHPQLENLLEKIQDYNPKINLDRIQSAYDFAKNAHEGQFRASGEPYIMHPLAAAHIIADIGGDEDTLIACLLHDVVEDTSIRLSEIKEKYGKNVAILVDGVTKISKVKYKDNYNDFKINNLKKMFLSLVKDRRSLVVKIADRIHNMQTLGNLRAEKQERIAKETWEIFVPLANLLGIWKWYQLLEKLCFQILYPEIYKELLETVYHPNSKYQNTLSELIESFYTQFRASSMVVEILGYEKTKKSLIRALKPVSAEEFSKIFPIRILTDSIEDCYKALGLIHQNWKPIPGKLKDFISIPKYNNYQSIHTTVFGHGGNLIEIQICTHDMQKQSEVGAIFFHKSSEKTHEDWIEEIVANMKRQSLSTRFIEHLQLSDLQRRIFVFTPEGDVVDLPIDSNPIDFAFAIHSEIGKKYYEAEVNGTTVPKRYKLNTGDIVRIVTSEKILIKREWLDIVRTQKAKNIISEFLGSKPDHENILNGRNQLREKLELIGNDPNIHFKEKEFLLKLYKEKSMSNFYKSIAIGEIHADDVVESLYEKEFLDIKSFWSRFLPVKLKKLHEGQNITLVLHGVNRIGLIADISEACKNIGLNIEEMRSYAFTNKTSLTIVNFNAQSFHEFQYFTKTLKSIPGIKKVLRYYKSRNFLATGSMIVSALFGITYPILFYFMYKNKIDMQVYTIIGLILITLNTLFFKNITKYLSAEAHSIRTMWNIQLGINISIALFIVIESVIYNVQYEWELIIGFLLLFLGYTFIEYYQFKNENI